MTNGNVHNGYLGVEVSVSGPLLVITETMNRAREELSRALHETPRAYSDHKRLLDEYQAAMRAFDILSGFVDVKGNALGQTNGLIIDERTVNEATRVVNMAPTGKRNGLAAVAEALELDTQPQHVEEPEEREQRVTSK